MTHLDRWPPRWPDLHGIVPGAVPSAWDPRTKISGLKPLFQAPGPAPHYVSSPPPPSSSSPPPLSSPQQVTCTESLMYTRLLLERYYLGEKKNSIILPIVQMRTIGPEGSLVQFSSVAQSCPALCDPMDCSTPGFPVHHQLPELTQTHVHRVGDTIQPSHPLLSLYLPAFYLSQHQGLLQWVSSLHQVAKESELQLQHQSFQWIFMTDFL